MDRKKGRFFCSSRHNWFIVPIVPFSALLCLGQTFAHFFQLSLRMMLNKCWPSVHESNQKFIVTKLHTCLKYAPVVLIVTTILDKKHFNEEEKTNTQKNQLFYMAEMTYLPQFTPTRSFLHFEICCSECVDETWYCLVLRTQHKVKKRSHLWKKLKLEM